jgi:hypothetical protein
MDAKVGGCTGPCASILLISSEGSPFWSGIDAVFTQNQTASGANYLAFLGITNNLGSSTIGAPLDVFT